MSGRCLCFIYYNLIIRLGILSPFGSSRLVFMSVIDVIDCRTFPETAQENNNDRCSEGRKGRMGDLVHCSFSHAGSASQIAEVGKEVNSSL